MLRENLKKYREASGMTAKTLADRVGISDTTYRNYENTDRQPDYKTLKKIAKELQVSVDQLLVEAGEELELLYDPETYRKRSLADRAIDGFGRMLLNTEEYLLLDYYRRASVEDQKRAWVILEAYSPQNAVRIYQEACLEKERQVDEGKITIKDYDEWRLQAESKKDEAARGKLPIYEFRRWINQH